MSPNEIILIICMAVITFGIRYFLLAYANRIVLPDIIKESLKFIAPSVLTAITVPAVMMPSGNLDFSIGNPYFLSACFATLAGIATKNVLFTIVVGLVSFFLFRVIF